MYLMIKSETDT